jgi:hypothetical protein
MTMNWYYEIWVDAIKKAETSKSYMTHKDKMFVLLSIFSFAQGFNLQTFFIAISPLWKINSLIWLDIFPGNVIDKIIAGLITFYLPFFIINYFLIFYKGKYKSFIVRKKLNSGGKLFMLYFVFSILLFFVVLIVV